MWPHPIFVINLARSPERREAASAQLARLGLTPTFVEAVDGHRLSEAEIAGLVDVAGRLRRAPKPLTKAEVGCYLSHWAVLERIVDEDIPQALILEDDLLAGDDLPGVLAALAAKPLPPYDMVKLGISEPQTKAFTPITALTAGSELVRHHNVVNSNLAYVITRRGAERFLRYGRPIRYPVDVAMNRSWRHGLDILGVRPWPVLPNPAFASTIGEARFEEGSAGYRLQRRARKAYDSLAKRRDVVARLRRDAAWRAGQPARASSRASRVIAAPAETLYRAFLDPETLIAWLPPGEMTGKIHQFEAGVGGGYRMSLYYPADEPQARGKTTAREDGVRVRFVELSPPRRIVELVNFDSEDPSLQGDMRLEVTFTETAGGTEVAMLFEDMPPGLSAADNDAGARLSLDQLARRFGQAAPVR